MADWRLHAWTGVLITTRSDWRSVFANNIGISMRYNQQIDPLAYDQLRKDTA